MKIRRALLLTACLTLPSPAFGQALEGPSRITLDQAIELAYQHNHNLLATRTTVQQSLANEVTANLRPNPTFFTDWEYLPLISGTPSGTGLLYYLENSTEGDVGLSYMFERGQKRQHRVQAAKDATSVVRAQLTDSERSLAFNIAQLFINVQLAESTLALAGEDLKSFQVTTDVSEHAFETGAMSENDFLKVKVQLVQFQTDVQQYQLARVQALSDLRQQLGFESVPDRKSVV